MANQDTAPTNGRTPDRSPRTVVLALALVHLVPGVLGFILLPGNTVWIFSTTGMLDLLRAATGVLGLFAVLKPAVLPLYGWFVFVAFAGLTAFGILSAATNQAGDAVNLNWADNVLHALTALAAFAVTVVLTRGAKRARAEATGR